MGMKSQQLKYEKQYELPVFMGQKELSTAIQRLVWLSYTCI